MKIVNGLNPNYADHDEIDQDALEAVEDFGSGQITYEELRIQVGPEAAQELLARLEGEDPFLPLLFDDPESF